MQRRKFLVGLGSLAAGSAAAIGTGAFEGAYVHADRSLDVGVVNDSQAFLSMKATSPHASYERADGGWERGQLGDSMLKIEINRLNVNADTRLDDVFRIQNTTGSEVKLTISDSPDWNGGYEDAFQVWAQPTNGGTDTGSAVRLDDGGYISLGAGEAVEINILVLLKQYDPNGFAGMNKITVTADGTDA